ncbi:hypothetical protein QBK99_06455 [Corticibacterium sp. UT-5YL-CI-8]|nr:hypothetical protein [Tianweitania sp. UT-5YL-CI-8]
MNNDLLRNAIYYCEALRKRPLYAIIPAVVTLAIAMVALFTMPRIYQADALLMIDTPQSQSTLLPATVTSEQLQFVEQRVLAREKLLALANEFDLFPGVRQTMSDTMLAELVRRQVNITTVATESSERYSGTSAMRIGFSSDAPEQASAVAARLVEMIIDENRRLRIVRASEMTAFLEREAIDLTERTAKRDREWNAYLAANSDAMPSRVQSLDSELQEKDREAATTAQAISTLIQDIRLSEAESRLGVQRSEGSALAARQLAELEAELTARSVTYSAEHPDIRSLNQRIESLKRRIAQAASGTNGERELSPELALVADRITIGKTRHEDLLSAQSEIQKRIAELRAIIARAPAVQAQVEAFERDRDSMQRAADDINSRLSAARSGERLERSGSISHVQIIEQPETPRDPVSPNRKRLMLMSLAAAMGFGFAGIYIGDAMQRSIRGSFDLRDVLAGSTLVMIPHFRPESERKFFADAVLDRIAGTSHGSPAKA